MSTTRLLLVRHGESLSNVSETATGWLGSELSEKGHWQVERLGERLKDESVDRILSSDLHRARQTAAAIAKHHSIEVEYLESLRERSYGVFDGKAISNFIAARDSSPQGRYSYQPENGESIDDLLERANSFWSDWQKELQDQTTIISCHGTMNKTLLLALCGKSYKQWDEIAQDNACLNILERKRDGDFSIRTLNCTAHFSD